MDKIIAHRDYLPLMEIGGRSDFSPASSNELQFERQYRSQIAQPLSPRSDLYTYRPVEGVTQKYFNAPGELDGPVTLAANGKELIDSDLYFKNNGKCPLYLFEGGECDTIRYDFQYIRLVPIRDNTKGDRRTTTRIGDRVINGAWKLEASLYLTIQRTIKYKLKAPSNLDELPQREREKYNEQIKLETIHGRVANNVVLATSKLVYKSRACEQTKGKPPGVDFDWYFEIDEIEKLEGLNILQDSGKETGKFLEDEFGDLTIPIYEKFSVADRIKSIASLGDDSCWTLTNPDGSIELQSRPITQHIIWQNHSPTGPFIGALGLEERKTGINYYEATEENWYRFANGTRTPEEIAAGVGAYKSRTQEWFWENFKQVSFFLEPPTGFLGASDKVQVEWIRDRRHIYYGKTTKTGRGNDTILVARGLEETSLSAESRKFDPNWLNFDSDRKKSYLEMYMSFVDPTFVPEMGSPDWTTSGVPMKDPYTGRTVYIRYLIKNLEIPNEQALSDVWDIINNGGLTTTDSLKLDASGKALISKSATTTIYNSLFSTMIPIKKLKSKTVLLPDGTTFTNEGTNPAYWTVGEPAFPDGWYKVTDPRPADEGGTGFTGYVNPYIGQVTNTNQLGNLFGDVKLYTTNGKLSANELKDKAGNVLIQKYPLTPEYNTSDSLLQGSVGCPPLTGVTHGLWKESPTGLILNEDYRYGDLSFSNNEYAARLAYSDLLNKRKNAKFSSDPNSRIASLNPGFIVERGNFSDDRKFFQPYGPTPKLGNYFFRDIRFIPEYSEVRGKGDRIIGYDRAYREVGNKIIPGAWNLVADLYLYIPTFGASGLIREFVGILYPDYVLSKGSLYHEVITDCEGIYGWNSVKYEYRFSVDEIESLAPLYEAGFASHARNIRQAINRVRSVIDGVSQTQYNLGGTGFKPGDEQYASGNLRFNNDYVNPYNVRYNPNGTQVGYDPFQQLSSYKYVDELSLVDHLIKQNKFESINNTDWQPYDFRNEKYWSYSFGSLPVLIDNEPKGVFGELIKVNASNKYITTKPIPNFPNKVVGETPCTQSWDFRSEIPKSPVDVDTLNLVDCADTPFDLVFSKKRLTVDRLPDTETLYPIEPGPVGFDIPVIIRTKNVEESDRFLSRDPNSPCFQGFKTTYDISEYYEVTHSKLCWQPVSEDEAFEPNVIFDGLKYKRYTALYSGSIEIQNTKEVRWENPETVYCDCVEVKVEEKPFLDPDDPCGCKEIYLDSVYKICVDDGLYYYENKIVPPNALPVRTEQRFGISTECGKVKVKVMHDLDFQKDIVFAKNKLTSKGLFDGTDILSCYATSSRQLSGSKQYYYDVINCNECNSDSYFAVSYGHLKGSGSTYNYYEEDDTPTRSVYSQYRLLTLEEPQTSFQFYKTGSLGTDLEDVYVLNFYRNSMEDRLDPGNFELSLVELNGGAYANKFYTGSNVQVSSSNKVITLIDNSSDTTNQKFCVDSPYTSFDLVSGSLVNGIYDTTTTTTYGTMYPLLGVVVLDASKLNTELSFNTVTGSNINGDNHYKLYTSVSGASSLNFPMRVRTSTNKNITEYFIRIPHMEANYSNNPTFNNTKGDGAIFHECFKNDPVTYITTVGLYNNTGDLVAVGKTSKPIKKTADDELYLKINLSI